MFSLPLGIRVCWPWSTLSSDLPSSSTYCWWGVFVSSMVGSSFGQKCLLLVCIVCLFFLFIMILIFIFCSSEERFCEALPTLEHPIFDVGIWKLKLPGMFEIWICPRTEIGRRDENFWTSYQHFFFVLNLVFCWCPFFSPFFFWIQSFVNYFIFLLSNLESPLNWNATLLPWLKTPLLFLFII